MLNKIKLIQFSFSLHEKNDTSTLTYCLNIIFQKLHFFKILLFCETPQEKYDHAIFLQLMSPKKCHNKFENRFTNKIIMSKNILNRHFACARELIHTPSN